MVVSFSRCKSQNTMGERLVLQYSSRQGWMCSLPAVCRGYRVDSVFHSPVVQPSLKRCGCFDSSCVCEVCFVTLWVCEIVFPMTDREMLTLTSQPIPIKTHRLWLMALLVCGFAQMGLHLSQDPCCLHSDPQRRAIRQLSFVNVRFVFIYLFSYFVPLPHIFNCSFSKNPLQYSWCVCLDVMLAKVIGIHSFTFFLLSSLAALIQCHESLLSSFYCCA